MILIIEKAKQKETKTFFQVLKLAFHTLSKEFSYGRAKRAEINQVTGCKTKPGTSEHTSVKAHVHPGNRGLRGQLTATIFSSTAEVI